KEVRMTHTNAERQSLATGSRGRKALPRRAGYRAAGLLRHPGTQHGLLAAGTPEVPATSEPLIDPDGRSLPQLLSPCPAPRLSLSRPERPPTCNGSPPRGRPATASASVPGLLGQVVSSVCPRGFPPHEKSPAAAKAECRPRLLQPFVGDPTPWRGL